MRRHVVQAAEVICRTLRRNSTKSEKLFWVKVKNRKFLGKKFLRQHPLFFKYHDKETFFIVDFYCHEHRLVVELDGKSHDYQKDYDALRTYIINAMDMNVVRFRNDEIEQDLQGVLKKLEKIIKKELAL
jgi:very-short-patch-repair endonuclease